MIQMQIVGWLQDRYLQVHQEGCPHHQDSEVCLPHQDNQECPHHRGNLECLHHQDSEACLHHQGNQDHLPEITVWFLQIIKDRHHMVDHPQEAHQTPCLLLKVREAHHDPPHQLVLPTRMLELLQLGVILRKVLHRVECHRLHEVAHHQVECSYHHEVVLHQVECRPHQVVLHKVECRLHQVVLHQAEATAKLRHQVVLHQVEATARLRHRVDYHHHKEVEWLLRPLRCNLHIHHHPPDTNRKCSSRWMCLIFLSYELF
mmetsp:Transcript_8016/g.12551  ORF Transcript_8016/g.12551 Transcript_8016/m.12551 type:complete len:259 (-) Transcript_8016:285-1061(-)